MSPWLLAAALAGAAPPVTVWSTDLQADDGSLVPSGSPGQWEWGEVVGGPGSGVTGPKAWATRLDQVHMNNADDHLGLPDIPLDDTLHPVLVLTHWYELEPDDADHGQVELRETVDWAATFPLEGPASFQGSSDGWKTDYFPLDGLSSLADVRLRFQADSSVARFGWVVGELTLVDGDPVPPSVVITEHPEDTQDLAGPHPVAAVVTDNVEVSQVELVWYAGAGEPTRAPMVELDGQFEGSLPGAAPGTAFVWWVEAQDTAGNIGVATGPSFRVYLPAPTNLTAPEGRWVDTTVPLQWEAPESIWPVRRYTIYRNGAKVQDSTSERASAPVTGPRDTFTVSAWFDTDNGTLEGDPCDSVGVEAHPPTILRIAPSAAWPGDTLVMEVVGRYLLLTPSDLTVDAGPGITVDNIDVVDVDTVRVRVTVDDRAAPGTNTVTLRTNGQEVSADGAFEIRSDSTRPGIRRIAPSSLVRGERQTLTLRTNVSLPTDLRLHLGTGVVVESATRLDDLNAKFVVSTAYDAPTGKRVPELDIGTRLLTGPSLDVRAPQPESNTGCHTTPVRPPHSSGWMWVALIMGVGSAFRRQEVR